MVLKLFSESITHKTDVGGVQLNLRDDASVRAAYAQIESSVREKAGAEHFLGVTVQPMVKLDGYEFIVGSTRRSAVWSRAVVRDGRTTGGSVQGPGAWRCLR